jgi:two-component system response regulator NreC
MSGQLHAVDGHPADGSSGIRVILADDHPSLRRSLRRLLESEDDMNVVGEAGDLETAIRGVRSHGPDVLVLDLRMPDGASSERIKRLREQSPRTAIVIITLQENQMFADLAAKAGAIGFVLKDRADQELADAVRHAARGREYRSPHLRAP